jgi:hypothetical protein
MMHRALLSAVAAAFALVACNSSSNPAAPTPASTPAAVVQAPAAEPPKSDPPQQVAQAATPDDPRAALRKKYLKMKECDAQDCSITVTASACDKSSIVADPDTLAVVKTHRGVLIVWKVTSPGYTFDPKNGITLKDSSQGQFRCKARSNATEYDCVNKNDNPAITEYQYAITLVSGGKTCTTDPVIVNGF